MVDHWHRTRLCKRYCTGLPYPHFWVCVYWIGFGLYRRGWFRDWFCYFDRLTNRLLPLVCQSRCAHLGRATKFWFKWLIALCFIGLYCLIYILFSEHTPILDVPRLTVQILALSNIFGALLILGLPVVIYSGQLESQKQLATTEKLELDEKHQDLISSLNYAARMQRTILTSEEAIQDVFPGSLYFGVRSIYLAVMLISCGDAFQERVPCSAFMIVQATGSLVRL